MKSLTPFAFLEEVMPIINCSICEKPISVNREKYTDPPQAEKCTRCFADICPDCIDLDYMMDHRTEEVICRHCSQYLS